MEEWERTATALEALIGKLDMLIRVGERYVEWKMQGEPAVAVRKLMPEYRRKTYQGPGGVGPNPPWEAPGEE